MRFDNLADLIDARMENPNAAKIQYVNVEQFEGCEYIEEVIEIMEERLFRGCNHYKRGVGIQLIDVTKFPNYDRVVLFLNNLFD